MFGGEFFIDSSGDCSVPQQDTACCDSSSDYIKNGECVEKCCGYEGDDCAVDLDCCQGDTPDYPPPLPEQHCSLGINDELTQGYCCPFGQYWDPIAEGGSCQPAITCYGEDKCPYDSHISEDFELLLKDYRCLMRDGIQPDHWDPPYNEVCCHTSDCFGEDGFCWCDIETLGLGGEPGGEPQK